MALGCNHVDGAFCEAILNDCRTHLVPGTSWQLQEDTRGVKSTQQILTLFADVSQRRNDYIEIVSLSRGVPQLTSWGGYTREEWRLWLRENSFDEEDMHRIVSTWKQEFELNDFRETEKVQQWRKEGTRDSKKKLVKKAHETALGKST